jgi:hypothetical protein
MKNRAARLVVVRCRAGRDPGERFRAMEHRPIEREEWAAAQTAIIVRPSSAMEVQDWLNHPSHVVRALGGSPDRYAARREVIHGQIAFLADQRSG